MKKKYIRPECEEINTEFCVLTSASFPEGTGGTVDAGDELARPTDSQTFDEEDLDVY